MTSSSNRNPGRPMMRTEPCRQPMQHMEPNCRQMMPRMEQRAEMPRRGMENRCPVKEPRSRTEELGCMNQEQLLRYIDQVSFVISDMILYLDTHPDDRRALDYFNEHLAMRKTALKEYARLYGPLTVDTADDASSESWEWVNTPWPWEGRLK